MKKLFLIILLLVPVLAFSGCSNNLQRWSETTAYKLLSKANKGYKVKIIKCSKSYQQGSYRIADCTYYLIKGGKIQEFKDENYKKKTFITDFYRNRHSKFHKKWKISVTTFLHPHFSDPIKEMQQNGWYY